MASKPPPLKNLSDLRQVQRTLAVQREQEAQAQAQRAAAEKLRQSEQKLFAHAIGAHTGATQPLRAKPSVVLRSAPPAPVPLPTQQRDEPQPRREPLSDEFDVTALLDPDDQMSYRRPGIGIDVTRNLRAGEWPIQREIDLHGLRIDAAREAFGTFIHNAHAQGVRCVRVVHGKGLSSPGRQPVLKIKAQRWLIQKTEVLAFVQASAAEGGAGALIVLLQPVRR